MIYKYKCIFAVIGLYLAFHSSLGEIYAQDSSLVEATLTVQQYSRLELEQRKTTLSLDSLNTIFGSLYVSTNNSAGFTINVYSYDKIQKRGEADDLDFDPVVPDSLSNPEYALTCKPVIRNGGQFMSYTVKHKQPFRTCIESISFKKILKNFEILLGIDISNKESLFFRKAGYQSDTIVFVLVDK